MVNNWLIESFRELGLDLQNGNLKKSTIKDNCFGTSFISDLIDQNGFKRIRVLNLERRKFIQHGEIQINPSKNYGLNYLEESPPQINFNITNDEIIRHLKNSFFKESNLLIENIEFK